MGVVLKVEGVSSVLQQIAKPYLFCPCVVLAKRFAAVCPYSSEKPSRMQLSSWRLRTIRRSIAESKLWRCTLFLFRASGAGTARLLLAVLVLCPASGSSAGSRVFWRVSS